MRLLTRVSFFGPGELIHSIAAKQLILNGTVEQIGLGRKIPEKDAWIYSSPLYRFDIQTFEDDLPSFLAQFVASGLAANVSLTGQAFGILTICPIRESEEDEFGVYLSREVLKAILELGLALEVAPASVMPEGIAWARSPPNS